MRRISIAMAVASAAGLLSLTERPRAFAADASSCDITTSSRVIAIGDVHGAADRFSELLQLVGLVDNREHWAGGTAHLVQLGDVVDRGPDSRKAIDLLQRLEGEAQRAGGAVHALLGNHEVARMLGDMRFATAGEYAAFAGPESEKMREGLVRSVKGDEREKLLKETPLGFVELRQAFGRQGSYGQWLRKRDVVVRINGVVFLHGGISPAVADFSCSQINTTVRKELTDDLEKTRAAPLASLAAREDGPLWYRGLAQLPDSAGAQMDDTLGRQHARAIVIAHTVSQDGRIRMRFDGRLFQIDTGMQPAYVPNGRASALEFNGATVTAIYTDRRETLREPGTEK